MPIYEYECTRCRHYFDVLQKISDERLKFCPECGKETLRKLISAPNFRLKGGGWYETDFKQDKRRNIADSGDDKPPAKDGGKDGGKDAGKDGGKDAGKDGGKSGGKADHAAAKAGGGAKPGGGARADGDGKKPPAPKPG